MRVQIPLGSFFREEASRLPFVSQRNLIWLVRVRWSAAVDSRPYGVMSPSRTAKSARATLSRTPILLMIRNF